MTIIAALSLMPPASAQSDKLRPPLNYGHTDRTGAELSASEQPNQIRLSQALRQDVRSRADGTELGKVQTIFLDPRNGIVSTAKLDKGGALVAWSSLMFVSRPTPHFETELARDDLKNAPRSGAQPGLEDVNDILSKKAVGPHGEKLGTVADIIGTIGDGTIVAIVLNSDELLKSDNQYAVAWSAVADRRANGDVQLSVTPEELARAPTLTTKAPSSADRGGSAGTPESGTSGTRKTLDFGGQDQEAPAPATRRK